MSWLFKEKKLFSIPKFNYCLDCLRYFTQVFLSKLVLIALRWIKWYCIESSSNSILLLFFLSPFFTCNSYYIHYCYYYSSPIHVKSDYLSCSEMSSGSSSNTGQMQTLTTTVKVIVHMSVQVKINEMNKLDNLWLSVHQSVVDGEQTNFFLLCGIFCHG